MVIFLAQSSQQIPEALKFLEQILVALGVSIGAGIGAYVAVVQWSGKIKDSVRKLKAASEQMTESKDEIVRASERNYQEIKANTDITEETNSKVSRYVDTVQKHLVSRLQDELNVMRREIQSLKLGGNLDEETNTEQKNSKTNN